MLGEPVLDPDDAGQALCVQIDGDDQTSVRRVTVAGELDMLSAVTLDETITDLLRGRPRRIEVDLRAVTFLDSAGIRTLVMCHAAAGRGDCELALVDPHPQVYTVLQIAGLLEHFHLTAEPAASERSTYPG